MPWVENQTQKCIPLSTITTTAKTKSLFVMLKEKPGPYYDVELLLALSGLNNSRTVIHYII